MRQLSRRDGASQRAVLCFLIAVVEGFDLQVAGIAAPGIRDTFGIGAGAMGWFFSASTIGLFFGALLGGHLSDRVGRERVLSWSVAGFGVASILTGLASSSEWLIAARAATGVGIGGALPNLVALASESAAPGRERRAVALLYCGLPTGGAAVSLLGAFTGVDWRSPFFIGGVLPLLLAFALRYAGQGLRHDLSARNPTALPIGMTLFGEGRAISTVLLWISFFAALVILYLVLNWLPTLLMGLGLDARTAFFAQLSFNIGGLLLCALSASTLDGRNAWIAALVAFGGVPVLLATASGISTPASVITFAFLLGGAVIVTQSYLYAFAPRLYPAAGRGMGVGAAVAVGRFGSIAGPLLGAALLTSGGDSHSVLRGAVPVAIIAGIAAIALAIRERKT